jgi:hypothetical protein
MNEVTPDDERLARTLVGSWELVHWQISYPATGRVAEPFGQDARGLIVYAPDGYMSVLMHRAARLPGRAWGAALSECEQAQGFTSYIHYAGRWRIEQGEVVHDVQHALHPDLVGTQQRRRVALRGDQLTLSGEERFDAAGSIRAHSVLWRRTVESQRGI